MKLTLEMLDQVSDIIVSIDDNGLIIHANQAAVEKLAVKTNHHLSSILHKNNVDNLISQFLQSPPNSSFDNICLLDANNDALPATLKIFQNDSEKVFFFSVAIQQDSFSSSIAEKVKLIEALSKSSKLRTDIVEDAFIEIMRKAHIALDVNRLSIWMFDNDKTYVECVASLQVDKVNNEINQMLGQRIYKEEFPQYFAMLCRDDVIVTDDVLHEPQTAELVNSYLLPYHISSMLDVPIRSNSLMIGAICFEHTGTMRKWSVYEVKFGLLIAQLIALYLESQERNKALMHLSQLLEDKKNLMNEIKYRTKSNNAIVNAIVSYYLNKTDISQAPNLLHLKSHILGISGVHEIILESYDYESIRFNKVIYRIIGLVESMNSSKSKIDINIAINDIAIHVSKALPLSLIIYEITNHAYHHSFQHVSNASLTITMQSFDDQYQVVVKDNGNSITEDSLNNRDLLCLKLVEIFVQELGGSLQIESGQGNKFTILFPVAITVHV
ncbi:MAG: GAF domain-containing protein [Candidatus Competibacteraceae bacterium]|nr:GAF domain-containing protein [Candidatus Competibacteraceae bacterium]